MPDPDLEIRRGGGGGGGKGGLPKQFSRPFGPQFCVNIRGAPGPSPGSATVLDAYVAVVWTGFGYRKLISTPPFPQTLTSPLH